MTEINNELAKTMPLSELTDMLDKSFKSASWVSEATEVENKVEQPEQWAEVTNSSVSDWVDSSTWEQVTNSSTWEEWTNSSTGEEWTDWKKLTGVQKLLHQRSELRQDNDRLKTELEEAREQLRKLKAWELDSEFFDAAWEVDAEKKSEAIQDAKIKNMLIERDYNQSNNRITNSREVELAQFFIENPDLWDIKSDIIDYAERHKDLDIEDVKYLVLSRVDPTRLLDQQTRNKLKWWFDIPWDTYVPDSKPKSPKDMTSKELLSEIKRLGLL